MFYQFCEKKGSVLVIPILKFRLMNNDANVSKIIHDLVYFVLLNKFRK